MHKYLLTFRFMGAKSDSADTLRTREVRGDVGVRRELLES